MWFALLDIISHPFLISFLILFSPNPFSPYYPFSIYAFLFSCFHLDFAASPDEQCEAAASSPQPHPLPASVWGARKQSATRYSGRKCRMWWGQEEPLLWPLIGAGATTGELHECGLSKRPIIWLWPELPLQGKGWNADPNFNCSHTVCSQSSLQCQMFNRSGASSINFLKRYTAVFAVSSVTEI